MFKKLSGKLHSFRRRLSPAKIFFFINLAIIIVVFLLGFKPNAFRKKVTTTELAAYNNQALTLDAWVCEEADLNIKSRRLTVCAIYLETSGEIKKVSGKVLVTMALYPIYDYGDFIKISGRLETIPKIDGFDYDAYLARYNIYSVMYYPKISRLTGTLTTSQMAYRLLLDFKQKLKSLIDSALPEPEAGLGEALLLGYRRSLATTDLDIFARVGLSHIIAISGTHITILSALIINFFLALGFKRRHTLKIIFIFLFLYPIITGLGASAVRASVMGGLAFLAVNYHRSNSLIKALVFAAALMLIFNPLILRYDVGFQLSFLALLGIIYIYPLSQAAIERCLVKLELKTKYKNRLKLILDIFNLTLIVQVAILPVMIINFQQLSLIAPVSNLLVLWALPLLLACLIIGLILSALLPAGGVIFFAPAYFLLKFIFIVVAQLAAPNWAAVAWTNFNWTWGALYYLILVIAINFLTRRKKQAKPA